MPDEHGFAEFASLYEKMVDWDRRLARELPFYRRLFADHRVRSVLDMACGPGRHAAAFAGLGLRVTAVDPNAGMLALAREQARRAKVEVELVESDFLSVGSDVQGPFDAVVCVGNSFPALPGAEERLHALRDFASLLNPGGILVLHLLNYDRLLKEIDAGAPTHVRTSADGSMRFMKSFRRVGTHLEMSIEFKRTEDAGGRLVHELFPVGPRKVRAEIEAAGMIVSGTFGDYEGGPFDPEKSEDLIVVADRP